MYYGGFSFRERPRTGKPKPNYPLVRDIEERSGRTVSIETELTEENLSKCLLKFQSPLFRLPAEVRNAIFGYTCQSYPNENPPFKVHDYYYRPESRVRQITSTSLVRTCRRAWLEANHLPLEMGDHTFWFIESDRRPSSSHRQTPFEEGELDNFLHALTINNCIDFKQIHFYAHMMWLEASGGSKCVQNLNVTGVCPEIFTLTIRYSDWWWWEYGQRLRLDEKWLENILKWPALPRLREIRLELEVPEPKLSELQSIEEDLRDKFTVVERTDHYGTPAILLIDGCEEPSPIRKWSGMAPAKGQNTHGEEVLTTFVIKTLVWTVNLEEPNGRSPAKERVAASQSTHNPGPQLPVLSIERPDSSNAKISRSETDKETSSRLEQKWCEQGSLLKFAEDIQSTD